MRHQIPYMDKIFTSIKTNWFSIIFFVIIACIYCAPALITPFWGDNDGWSNLLPIIHYRISILNEHDLPFFTNLWYGGRHQWQNPLWSFLYLPATLIWLIFPLDWGMRIVLIFHLIFSLVAGKKLASLFLKNEVSRICAAIILTSPMLPSLLAVHIEKTLGWGWLLLSIYFLLNERYDILHRGIYSGLCWGTMALAGDNYHVFYAFFLLIPLTLSYGKKTLLFSLLSGASIGLLHLPSVWYLVGYIRSNPSQSIPYWSMSFWGIATSLMTGFAQPVGWETWALIGIPVFYLFMRSLFLDLTTFFINHSVKLQPQKIALIISLISLSMMATGVIYKWTHLLDTFRVPARAIALIALTITLYILTSLTSSEIMLSSKKQEGSFFWIASAIQIAIFSMRLIQPAGSLHSPYDTEAQKLAILLNDKQAKSVWLNPTNWNSMYLDVVLTQHGIALPNVYYGDMGQQISVNGPYCGYSFDYLIIPQKYNSGSSIMLINAISYQLIADIPINNFQHIDQIILDSQSYDVYHVSCKLKQ